MKIDDPVIVWDKIAFGKHKMHYAGLDYEGKVQTWRNGKTSWSGKSKKSWKHYEKTNTSEFITNIQ